MTLEERQRIDRLVSGSGQATDDHTWGALAEILELGSVAPPAPSGELASLLTFDSGDKKKRRRSRRGRIGLTGLIVIGALTLGATAAAAINPLARTVPQDAVRAPSSTPAPTGIPLLTAVQPHPAPGTDSSSPSQPTPGPSQNESSGDSSSDATDSGPSQPGQDQPASNQGATKDSQSDNAAGH